MKWNVLAALRMARLGLTLLAMLFIALLASPAKAGTTTINTCGFTITHSGIYTLGKNLSCSSGVDGIDIEASNVALNLDNHTITGNCGGSYGIHVLGTSTAPLALVGILGPGTISSFTYGFWADYSANSLVNFVKVKSECTDASPVICSGGNEGFLINANSSQWLLNGVVVQAPETACGVAFLGNNSPVAGTGGSNVITGSNISDTITVGSNNNVVVANTASNNQGGIAVFGNNNQIHANTTSDNSDSFGIAVLLGAGNNITGNTAKGNSPYDLEDLNPDCGTDIWEGNIFTTANESCIH